MTGHPFERLSYDQEYDQALSYLYNLQKFGIKFGLSKTENLLKAFQHPQKKLKCIHVAGSNGKGSVAAMVSSVYRWAGYKVGLFTSPHLIDFRERFQISGEMISKERTLDLIKEIREKTDPMEPPTFFEFVTAMALLYFFREKVDVAVMEVGLGGRLDATNIIRPLVSVITGISLEHQEYLGHTPEKITREKAGIIKPGVPVITGAGQKKVKAVIEQVSREKQAPLLMAGRDFRTRKLGQGKFSYFGMGSSERFKTPFSSLVSHYSSLKSGLLGDHQIRNAGIVLTVVQLLQEKFPVPEDKIREGLEKVSWPGRMEVLSKKPWVILDGAHNQGAMRILADNLPKVFYYKRLLLVFGMMKDKDIGPTFRHILPMADKVFLTRAEYDRSAEPKDLVPYLNGRNLPYLMSKDISQAIRQALKEANPEDLILITGSLFIVGEARAWWEQKKKRSA